MIIKDIEKQLDTILHFLSLVHPSITSDKKNFVSVELRPILRKAYDFKLSQSINIWNLNEGTIERLRSFLELHNGLPYCLYYSVFSYDYDKNTLSKTGKKMQKGRINSSSAKYTEEIVLDFDNIDLEGYNTLLQGFSDLGIEALWVFSGHGYQAHILLDKPLYDKQALLKSVYKFRSKGFNADENCVDPARIMRVPHTYNCKCFTDDKYKEEIDNPPLAKIVRETNIRYSFEDILLKLDKLDTVLIDGKVETKENIKVENVDSKETNLNNNIKISKIVYPLNDYDLPEPILKMLKHTPHGYRNKVFGFLVGYFKIYLKLSKNKIETILKIWSKEACSPAYEEFNKDFDRFFYKNGLPYDTSLSSKFGYIEFKDYIQLQKQYIYIPSGALIGLNGKLLRVYLGIKLGEFLEKDTTVISLMKTLDIGERALRTSLKELLASNNIYAVNGNKKKGISNKYFTSKMVPLSDGFLKLSYNDARAYLQDLAIGELKLYLYMDFKFYSGDCFMSQANLGNKIGLAQNTVSQLVKSLDEKDYIKITRIYQTKYTYYNNYTLLR